MLKKLRKFYSAHSHRTGFVVAAIIFFWPLGLYLMWKHRSLGLKRRVILTTFFTGMTLLIGTAGYNAPPTIAFSVASYLNSTQTDEGYIMIEGKVASTHVASLTINDRGIPLDNAGSFSHKHELKEGDNTITVVAKSEKGTETEELFVRRSTAAEIAERERLVKEQQDKEKAEQELAKIASEKERQSKIDSAQEVNKTGKLYQVVSITDGDTIKVSIDGKTETIRLIGLDTPETKDPRKPVQCFGKEASSKMQSFVQSKQVRLIEDTTQDSRDKYGRLLKYVFLEDGRNVAYEMIKEGYAHEYTYSLPYKYQSQFKSALQYAKDNSKGLWSPTTCNGVTDQTTESSTSAPAPSTTTSPSAPQPAPTPAPQPAAGNCDPNYSPCVPHVSYDLDCGDIGFAVRVIGSDPHRFDANRDGYGCESYG